MFLIDRVLDTFPSIAVETEGAHAHFVHVGTAHDDSTSIAELLNGSRVNWRNEIFKDR